MSDELIHPELPRRHQLQKNRSGVCVHERLTSRAPLLARSPKPPAYAKMHLPSNAAVYADYGR
jgi:hypothetical protein